MPCLHDRVRRHRHPTFNPHGGPITHSSTGSKPDSLTLLVPKIVPRVWPRMQFTSYLPRDHQFWYQTQYLFPLLRTLQASNDCLPARNFPTIPPYFALDIVFNFHSRVTFRHLPRCYQPDSQPFRGLLFRSYPLSFVITMEFPKKGCQLHHDYLKHQK